MGCRDALTIALLHIDIETPDISYQYLIHKCVLYIQSVYIYINIFMYVYDYFFVTSLGPCSKPPHGSFATETKARS